MDQLSTLDHDSLAIFFNILVKTLLLQREPTEHECRVKFNGFFETWKAGRLGMREGLLEVKTETKQLQLDLRAIALLNCRNSKRSFEVHQTGKTVFEARFAADSPFKQTCSWLRDAVESARTPPRPVKPNIQTIADDENKFISPTTQNSPLISVGEISFREEKDEVVRGSAE